MVSVVLEGGTMRAIFSSGVLDGFLDNNIEIPYFIGVSGGIHYGINYLSKQKGRSLRIVKALKEYKKPNIADLLKGKNPYSLDFMFETIPNELVKFDYDTLNSYKGVAIAAVTNAKTGEPSYMSLLNQTHKNEVIKATCAVPGLYEPIEINNELYFDGGVSDSIPILKSLNDGNDKHIIILTQPKGFIKEIDFKTKVVCKMIEKKYPNIATLLRHRHEVYNLQVQLCEKLESQGKAIIIRPKGYLKSDETNLDKLQITYDEGKDFVNDNLVKIKNFILR